MPILSRSVGSCRRLCLCHTITKLLPKLQLFFSSIGEEVLAAGLESGTGVFSLSPVFAPPPSLSENGQGYEWSDLCFFLPP